MPALMSQEPCAACGGCHDYCLPDAGSMSMTGRYAYTCPVSGKASVLRPNKAQTSVGSCPVDSVLVKRVDSE